MSGTETVTQHFEFPCEFNGEYAQIPPHMQEAIRRYIVRGLRPGSFLQGVITNDLRMAVNNADQENLPLIKLYVMWFYNEAPGSCHGSPENMREWMNARSQDFVNH